MSTTLEFKEKGERERMSKKEKKREGQTVKDVRTLPC